MESTSGALSDQQIADFNRDGYLVLKGFATAEEVSQLRQRASELVEGFDLSQLSVFSTKTQVHLTDRYFLDSANNVSFFLEEKALSSKGPAPELQQAKALSINKIGHALHDLDPVFRRFSRSEKVARLLHSLGYSRALPVQSMYIFKQPKIGGEVRPHQDSTFLATDPPSVVGLWWALEDSTQQNGCLWALPGSHRGGVARRFIRMPDDKVTFDKELPQYDLGEAVPLEVPSGSLVVLHGAAVHFSHENSSEGSRHAYSMHVVEGEHAYPRDNWLQRISNFPFEPLTASAVEG